MHVSITWRHSIADHKQQIHSDERPFAFNHTGCSFRAKTNYKLTTHKNAAHLTIRDKRCHVCEKRICTRHLKSHMMTHEGDVHEMAECEDCSVNLKIKLSHQPAAGQLIQCDHRGCDYVSKCKAKSHLLSHHKYAHSEEKPFSCNHTGCSFRCKAKHQLKSHKRRMHLKIRTKRCHVCDKRFSRKAELCSHMLSQHQTNDHDIADRVPHLKENHKRSQAQTACRERRAGEERTVSSQNRIIHKLDIENQKSRAGGKEEGSVSFEGVRSEITNSLNDDLIDMHMDMQLLSSL